MPQRNIQVGGDSMQLVIGQRRPDPSGYRDRVDRLTAPKTDAVLPDQGKENAQIEPGVVRRQSAACQVRSDLRPQFAEIGRAGNLLPGQPMDIGKGKFIGRRPNQPGLAFHDPSVLHHRDPQRTGAVGVRVGSLKVDRGEIQKFQNPLPLSAGYIIRLAHPGFKPRIARRMRSFIGDSGKNCRIIHHIVEIYRYQHKQRESFVTPQQAIWNSNKGKGNRHAQDSL